MVSLIGVDPNLQISDLSDYRYQTTSFGYFAAVPQDESRYAEQMPQAHGRQHVVEQTPIAGLYRPTSIPEASRGFNPGRDVSSNRKGSEEQSSEIKDPTVYVPPHLLAPMKPNPPSLKQWRDKFFNIEEPLLLTTEEYLTYFPHVDNIYSHRSTQKYKRKPFVSHYWDCRLKGRPTGTPMNKKQNDGNEPEKKKRKRKVRERDLCDVKIKVTEFFGKEELEALRKLGINPDPSPGLPHEDESGQITFVVNGQREVDADGNADSAFGVLEPAQSYPPGHPGYGGKKWYMVQRVNGNDRDGDDAEDRDLDHKHTIDDSDRIKKNSVQRWLLAKEKERKKAAKSDAAQTLGSDDDEGETSGTTPSSRAANRFHASGNALQTLYSHYTPVQNHLTFYASSFCPFAQRIWIALEFMGVPYQYVEIQDHHWAWPGGPEGPVKLAIPELREPNPDGHIPCLKHNNFAVWESLVVLEYLEDLDMGKSLFPAGNAQLKAHSRLWVDFINRRILPVFYALILLPDENKTQVEQNDELMEHLTLRNAHQNPDATRNTGYNDERYPLQQQIPRIPFSQKSTRSEPSSLPPRTMSQPRNDSPPSFNMKSQTLVNSLLSNITTLVNASHCTGPYFLGSTMSYVDIAFAPWIIRLSRVLSYYRGFPRPEVGTRWQTWCEALENDEVIRRTVSEEQTYREVYGAMNSDVWEYDSFGRVDVYKARSTGTHFPEMAHARKLVDTEGFGLGGDIWGKMGGDHWPYPK